LIVCSQCGKVCSESGCYVNKKTGELWCMPCVVIEKKKRLKNYVKT